MSSLAVLKAICEEMPNEPGVYVFMDRNDYPLYVGKSISLKKRVSSYLREQNFDLEERIQRMVHEAKGIRHITTQTELLALLLEDALIKKFLPSYNIKQKQFRDYQYLRLTSDPYPRLQQLNARASLLETDYGPFRDRFYVDRLQEIFARYLGFRTCPEAEPSRSCLQLDLGQCLGPCVHLDMKDAYAGIVEQVRQFLEGRDTGIINLIETRMDAAAGDHNYESAKRCRDDLVFCDAFFNRQRFNHRFRAENLRIFAGVNDRTDYLFVRGTLNEVVSHGGKLPLPGEQTDLFDVSRAQQDDPRYLFDRANLVYNWIRRYAQELEFEFDSEGGRPSR